MDRLSMETIFRLEIVHIFRDSFIVGWQWDADHTKKKDVDMNKILSTATKALTVALAASTFSFAGPGLADGASKFVGNITTRGQVRSDFGTYWNQITAENECKWQSVEGSRGNRNFSGCKAAFNWAKNNGGLFKFHALLWGSQYPTWLESLSADDTKKAIMDWFDAVKKEFPEIDMIDVVNEAIRTGNNQYHSNYPKTKIIQAMGGDNNGDYMFIVNAFKEARNLSRPSRRMALRLTPMVSRLTT